MYYLFRIPRRKIAGVKEGVATDSPYYVWEDKVRGKNCGVARYYIEQLIERGVVGRRQVVLDNVRTRNKVG